MQRRSLFFNLLFAFLSITSLCFGQMPPGGMPMPSPDELQQIEAEIDNFVRNLPPEQQAQFYKDVEELTGIMEQMSPDELNSFVEGVFTDAGLMEEPPAQPEATQPEPVKEAPVKTPVTSAEAGPTQKALAMIDALISSTEEFLRKAQIIPELPGKMNKWVSQHKLLEVSGDIDWEKIETQIDDFNASLYTLKDKDPKTGEYRHIGELIKNEALYNNLAKLQTTLEQFVPQVTVPEFGLDKVSKESRAAIRDTLSGYLEAFYLLNVPTDIKKVQELYDPRAKELTEEEKQLAERAKAEVEKGHKLSPAERAGGQQATGGGYYGGYDPYDDYGYGGRYSAPSYSTPSYSSPSYSAPSSYDSGQQPSGGSSGSSGGGKSGSKPGAGKDDKSGKQKGSAIKDESKKPGDKKTGSDDKKDASGEIKHDHKINRELDRIISPLEDADSTLKSFDTIFTQFKDHLEGSKGFEKDFVNDKLADIPMAIQQTQKLLKKSTDAIKSFKKSLSSMNKETQDYYKKELASALKDHVKFYDTLRNELLAMKQMWDKGFKNRVHLDKRYVYFGEGKASAQVESKVTDVPPVTMFDLKETIEAFVKEAK